MERVTSEVSPGLCPGISPGISLTGLARRYGGVAALDGITLEVGAGEFFVVLGPSGCGKSTLLRLVAGLDRPDAGTVRLDGRRVADDATFVAAEERGVGVVFQSYALWPHMTVAEQVGFPVEVMGVPRVERVSLVAAALSRVSLDGFGARRPDALSGGQRQRVALARCLAQGARTILMDEPLANLDPHLRARMEDEIRRFHRESRATTLYITHDQREAMALADRVAVMCAGRVLQVDAPEALYRCPVDEFVAGFVGEGTIVDVELLAAERGGRVVARLASVELSVRAPTGTAAGPARLLLRPEALQVASAHANVSGTPGSARARESTRQGAWAGTVTSSVYRGAHHDVRVALPGDAAEVPVRSVRALEPGQAVSVRAGDAWVVGPGS